MVFNEFIDKYNINPDSYVWLHDESLENKRAIYLYDFCIITTKTIYTLITDTDKEVIKEIGDNVEVIDYSDMSLISIPNEQIKNILWEFIEVSNFVIN